MIHITDVLVGPKAPVAATQRTRAWLVTVAVVAVMATLNLSVHVLRAPAWVGLVAAALLLVIARASGLSWAQLGLARTHAGSGLRWGLGAVALVATIYLVAAMLPATRTAFLDQRYHLPLRGALMSALVVIPLGTVLVEEIAFRSVLWGSLSRHARPSGVLGTTSALFGLWHVLPALGMATANRAVGVAVRSAGGAATLLIVVGTVLFTAAGGLVAGELRRRSGSVLASAGMHWATNGLGVLFGLLAWHLVR